MFEFELGNEQQLRRFEPFDNFVRFENEDPFVDHHQPFENQPPTPDPELALSSETEDSDDEMATNNQRPEIYNGFGSPAKFFNKFEDWMNAKEKNRAQWMTQIKPFLKGGAYNLLADLAKKQDPAAQDYDLFKARVTEQFQDPRAGWVKTWAVKTKQKKNESVRKYAERFQTECEELDLDLESEGIKTSFVKGLRANLRTEVLKSGDISSFSNLLKAALVAEMATEVDSDADSSEEEDSKTKKELKQLKRRLQRIEAADPPEIPEAASKESLMLNRIDALSEQVGHLCQVMVQPSNNNSGTRPMFAARRPEQYPPRGAEPQQPQQYQPLRTRDRNPRTETGEPICRRCFEPGHFERSCPYEPRDRRNQYQTYRPNNQEQYRPSYQQKVRQVRFPPSN